MLGQIEYVPTSLYILVYWQCVTKGYIIVMFPFKSRFTKIQINI